TGVAIGFGNGDVDNIYVTGYFTGTVDFGPGTGNSTLTSTEGKDAFLVKLDKAGNRTRVPVKLGGNDDDWAQAVAVDRAGRAYVTGTNDRGNSNDAFVARFTAAGALDDNFHSTGQIFTDGDAGAVAIGNGIALDSAGNVYVVGEFSGDKVDFTP